ncbi:MAG: hypothetical protein DRG78_24710 [Epsilonproteobacteria bacterium]|nr:MAG: hypothetical protein DRG78_24710 [Campylobacterota bacterium]
MAKKEYDKALYRLLAILTKLDNDERPKTKDLAEEFGIGIRTIQKDISERLYNFPIEKDKEGCLIFHEGFSLKRTMLDSDELMFLNLALSQFNDVSNIDKIKNRIFQKLVNRNIINPYFIKQDDIEDLNIDSPKIERLERLIKERAVVDAELKHKTVEVELYKIANYEGFWYLFAKDLSDDKTKTFKFSDIKNIIHKDKYHKVPTEEIDSILNKTNSAFYSDGNSFEVLIKVYKEVAIYFKNKDFLESQKIVKENEDGSLEVSFEVSHDEDIDNIIKSWLPHVEVLKPERFRNKIINELKKYVKRLETN